MQSAVATHVPVVLSQFHGRKAEVEQLLAVIDAERLVTLTGIGGIGKTRLAFEVARSALRFFPDGIWVVELARVEDAELVSAEIAESVRAPADPTADPVERTISRLQIGRQLLVLDNCEHVTAAAGAIVRELLGSCHGLTILATGRDALHVEGERVWPVPPLDVPDARTASLDAFAGNESVKLFCDRARVEMTQGLSEETARDVVTICRAIDGLPLALELAAGWSSVLSIKQISQQVGSHLSLASPAGRGGTDRRRTMREALEWSHELFEPDERAVFACLSVFVGGLTLDGVAAVLAGSLQPTPALLSIVATLVQRSLLVADTAGEEARYRFLEPVRQFAAEKLAARPDDQELSRRRHLGYLADIAEASREPIRGGPDQPWLRRLDVELPNIRAALGWGFAHDHEVAARLATSLIWYCGTRDLLAEGRAWAIDAMREEGLLRARALHMAGNLSARLGDLTSAERELASARSAMLDSGELSNVAMVAFDQAVAGYRAGDLEAVRARSEEALELATQANDEATIMVSLAMMAIYAGARGEHERASDLHERALAIAQRRHHEWIAWGAACNLAENALDGADLPRARMYFDIALRNVHAGKADGEDSFTASLLENVGILAIQEHAAATGMRLLGVSHSIRELLRYRDGPLETERRRVWVERARTALGGERAEAAWRGGCSMSPLEAIDEARAYVKDATPTPRSLVRTFMFTDIVTSTELVGAIGDEAWHNLVEWHNRTLRKAFERHCGEEIDSAGDGFFVAFDGAASAVECAIDIQRTLAAHRQTHGFSPRVRIGVHQSIATQGGAGGYRGRGVHLSARVAASAQGDEILVTRDVVGQLGTGFVVTKDSRMIKPKGFTEEMEVLTVEWRADDAELEGQA